MAPGSPEPRWAPRPPVLRAPGRVHGIDADVRGCQTDPMPGIPIAAVDFYAELEYNNDRTWWAGHAKTWERSVRDPLLRLTEALAEEFGPAKLFRPHRDTRFSADKSPYKTHQGATVLTHSFMGYYVQVSATGLMTGGGWYHAAADQLARYREAVADDPGEALAALVDGLESGGYELGGETLVRAPRGYPADHPRLGLLRHKALTVGRHHGVPAWLDSDELAARVREDWRAYRGVIEWLGAHVGDTEQEPPRR